MSRPAKRTSSTSHPHATQARASMSAVADAKKAKHRVDGQPLRRGDACLMCRAKKLKCSATKPMCDQCSKRKDRCVYDAVRPASRVERLERKLAEMEQADLQEALEARKASSKQTPHQLNLGGLFNNLNNISNLNLPSLPIPTPEFNIYPFSTDSSRPTSSGACAQVDPMQSWSLPIDPFTVPDLSLSAPAGVVASIQPGQMPWPLLSSSDDISLWDNSIVVDPPSAQSHSLMSSTTDLNNIDNLTPCLTPNFNLNVGAATTLPDHPFANVAPNMTFGAPDMMPAPVPMDASRAINEVIDAAASGDFQLKENDISQSARNYLLDLFFAPPRDAFGSEPWTESQFRAKLALAPSSQPHPCLLFAMYTIAASSSYIPAVRSLADSLYTIAVIKIDESVREENRLLDTINACKMLCKWLWSKARPLEGYQMGWKAVSLVLACQLHKIPSGRFAQEQAGAGSGSENTWPLLGPPKDQWELGERIHAFWGVWGNDRGGCIMVPWPSGLSDEVITTPLPLASERYADGTAKLYSDVTISDLYTSPQKFSAFERPVSFLILAAHLLHRAQELPHRPPEASAFTYRKPRTSSPPCVRRDHPLAYAEMMDGVRNLLSALPNAYKINVLDSAPWSHPDVPTIHVMTLACRMLLHDLDSDAYDRDVCLSSAREIAGIIKLWIRQMKIDEVKDQRSGVGNGRLTNRGKHGLAGPYVLNLWYWTADRLIRGGRLLRGAGAEKESIGCAEDAKMIIDGFKSLGLFYQLSPDQADALERAFD